MTYFSTVTIPTSSPETTITLFSTLHLVAGQLQKQQEIGKTTRSMEIRNPHQMEKKLK